MDWRGAPVADPGHETLSDWDENTREGSRGFHLASPHAREIEAGKRKIRRTIGQKVAIVSIKLQMGMN